MSGTDAPPFGSVYAEPHWRPALDRVGRLTPREQETFLLLAEGLSNEAMAQRLHVSERTVRAHLAAVMGKLELGSRLTVCLASYTFLLERRSDARPGELEKSST